ncbi:arsenate reductase [Aquimarina litoralis]|uniref:Arsenate reductase n=1 Tax=Aquimarina litoralis TaxID=584605 RepID=A0ABN1IJ64_9FLAO
MDFDILTIFLVKKIYHLSTCDTCKRILKELNPTSDFVLQDIKSEAITQSQLEEMKSLSGTYESLFSKRARLYKERDLKNKTLSENDYKDLILEHYTFLKRPVIIYDNQIFIGNSKKVVEAANKQING